MIMYLPDYNMVFLVAFASGPNLTFDKKTPLATKCKHMCSTKRTSR